MNNIAFAFEINGQSIDPSEVDDPQAADQLLRIADSVCDRMDGVYCQEHRQGPRFLCRGNPTGEFALEVFGCCESLVARAEQRLTQTLT